MLPRDMVAPRLPQSVLDRMTSECSPEKSPLQFLINVAWDGNASPFLRRDAAKTAREYLTDREARQLLPAILYDASGGDSGR